jgi:hypothetical protein
VTGINGTTQGATLLVLRVAIIGFALLLWSRGQASAGDITFVLTSFFLLQGYLRDVGVQPTGITHEQRWRAKSPHGQQRHD